MYKYNKLYYPINWYLKYKLTYNFSSSAIKLLKSLLILFKDTNNNSKIITSILYKYYLPKLLSLINYLLYNLY